MRLSGILVWITLWIISFSMSTATAGIRLANESRSTLRVFLKGVAEAPAMFLRAAILTGLCVGVTPLIAFGQGAVAERQMRYIPSHRVTFEQEWHYQPVEKGGFTTGGHLAAAT